MIDDGIKSYNHYRNEKKYNLALVYAIFSTILSVSYAVSFIAIGANLSAYIQFLGAFVFMLLVGLLRRRIQILTRYIAVLTSLALILVQSVFLFGNSFGFQYQVYPLPLYI